jgi:DNA replication licensing factor MCM4
MRLSPQVSEEDVDAAINLLQKATLFAATDPITGIIDMGIINSGRSEGVRKKNDEISAKIK